MGVGGRLQVVEFTIFGARVSGLGVLVGNFLTPECFCPGHGETLTVPWVHVQSLGFRVV